MFKEKSSKGVSRMFQLDFKEILGAFQSAFIVSIILCGRFKEVSRMFCVSSVFQGCLTC